LATRHRWDLIDFTHNRVRLPGIEASRGCPFTCNFCVLTGWEKYVYRPVDQVVAEIEQRMVFNRHFFGLIDRSFTFLDNNLGGSPKYLRSLCEALVPKKLIWGCALTFNILRDPELVRLMAKAGCRYIYTGIESLNPETLSGYQKGQNKLAEVDEVIARAYRSGIVLSFGLIVGGDGNTNEYLRRVPEYIDDLGCYSITFVGIVCPYPETPFFREVKAAGRLLPGTISRDYDGYTLCHKPARLTPEETVDHFQRLCRELGTWRNVARHYLSTMRSATLPKYKRAVLASGPEIVTIRNPVSNPARRYIAGLDDVEAWDRAQMDRLGIAPQRLS